MVRALAKTSETQPQHAQTLYAKRESNRAQVFFFFFLQFTIGSSQLGFQALGLTRGQWLSVAMFVFGVGILFYWMRTQTQTVHGWTRGENVKLGSRK